MSELDSDQEAQLAALNEINRSLRQQVIELVLSIAAMRENADLALQLCAKTRIYCLEFPVE